MTQLRIRSYFASPTDLAGEMRNWPEFVAGEGYSVDLQDPVTGDAVTIVFVDDRDDPYVLVSSAAPSQLFDRAVGRAVCALLAHSDHLMVGPN